jgi:hypothetical protein
MELLLFVIFFVILFMYLVTQIFYGKVASIYTATGLAIALSLIALGLSVHFSYVYKAVKEFWALEVDVFIALLVLLLVLVLHQRKHKYALYKTLIAITVGLAVMFPTGIFVMLIAACAHGDCL